TKIHLKHIVRHDEFACGSVTDLIDAHARRAFAQDKSAILHVDIKNRHLGNHLADATYARQRQRTPREQLAFSSLVYLLHGHDDLLGGSYQIHGATHPLDHLPRNLPISNVPRFGHFHGAKDRKVYFLGADHPETHRRIKHCGPRQHGDRLLACIDEIGILAARQWEWAHAQQAVLRLQHHVHVIRNVIGHKGGYTYAEIDVIAILDLLRYSFRDSIFVQHDA